MNHCKSMETSKDALFQTLGHDHRRRILEFLSEQPEEEIDCVDVVEYLTLHDISEADFGTLHIQCHHAHFPKLDKSGLITHHVDRGTVHIEQRELIEKLVEIVEKLEE